MSDTPPRRESASTAPLTHLGTTEASVTPSIDDAARARRQDSSKPARVQASKGEDWEAAVNLIRRSDNILLICHVSPDGDAIGSLLGLGLGLQVLGKSTTLACESQVPTKFSFLPGYSSIVNAIDASVFALVIGLDSSDPARLGSVYDTEYLAGAPLINIDHHVTNLFFGDVNLVDPEAASAAELVLTLLDHLGVHLSPNDNAAAVNDEEKHYAQDDAQNNRSGIATCLLTGIVTDTLGFRTSNVTPRVMAAAMRLMEAGASLSHVTYHAFNQRPLAELCLLAQGLNHMQAKDGLAWSEITLASRVACDYNGNGDAGLAGMLARTKEVHMAAVFTEKENNRVEISFRADPGFDVARLALSLGGGGHPAASGCTIEGSLKAAKARVLPMLRTALEKQRRSNDSR